MGLRENLWTDQLSQLPIRPAPSVGPGDSIRRTVEAMREARAGCALVFEGPELTGIFSERDLVKRVLASDVDLDRPVSLVMTAHPITARSSDSIGWAIRTMVQGHLRHLPVRDDRGRILGVVSVKQIAGYLADHFPAAVYTLPPDPRQIQTSREGA